MAHYIYIFVRTDLPIAAQIVQTNHATYQASQQFRQEGNEIPYMILIGVSDKQALEDVMARLDRYKIRFEAFHEPDNNMGLTAVTTHLLTNKERGPLRMYPKWTPVEAYSMA